MPKWKLAAVSAMVVLALFAALWLALPPSAETRYARVNAGMTLAEVEAAMGGPAGDPGETTGKFTAGHSERFAPQERPATRRYWKFTWGMVAADFDADGVVTYKVLLSPT